MAAEETLNVIALVSGGKDSFFSVLHCLANGHRVVALANLHPPLPGQAPGVDGGALSTTSRNPSPGELDPQHGSHAGQGAHGDFVEDEADLNSFMYQTVGHQVIPLYAQATGLPLFRRPIVGTAVHHGLSYRSPDMDTDRDHDPDPTRAYAKGDRPRPNQSTGSIAAAAAAREVGAGTSTARSAPLAGGRHPMSADVPDSGHDPSSDVVVLSSSSSPPSSLALRKQQGQRASDGTELDESHEEENGEEDETESLVPLLRSVLAAHPEANALCTGAILSTYQRTRIESVALRLGLVPLAYLWQFPELPLGSPHTATPLKQQRLGGRPSSSPGFNNGGGSLLFSGLPQGNQPHGGKPQRREDAQLLRDMAAVGLEARVVKVASAGLDEDFLWEDVASAPGIQRVERAMRRFGAASSKGAIIGEGGEFETLVVDGPSALFKGRIVVREEERRPVREGGGCAWLSIRSARVEMKVPPPQTQTGEAGDAGDPLLSSATDWEGVRIPPLLDPRFEGVFASLGGESQQDLGFKAYEEFDDRHELAFPKGKLSRSPKLCQEWQFVGSGRSVASVEEQTASVVHDIQAQLTAQSLPSNAITNTVIVLRHMSDFPTINKLYGSLFREPSPPSRVTISCGDELLPRDAAIAIYLTVQPGLKPVDRKGLHVQSRSYWAPANIGPYSQAVAVPLLPSPSEGESRQGALTAVCIAGQIPLRPASMALPSAGDADVLPASITLALQHLWRVGTEMRVQWWTSAVAYFPHTSSRDDTRRKALLAATAWRHAHQWGVVGDGDEDEDDEDGPDLWDRRYNSEYRSFGGDESGDANPSLPDWTVVGGGLESESADAAAMDKKLPLVFSAEVEELPRQAGVEWHAHVGLSGLGEDVVQSRYSINAMSSGEGMLDLHHVLVESPSEGVFVQTATVLRREVQDDEMKVSTDVLAEITAMVGSSLSSMLSVDFLREADAVRPKVTYVDSLNLSSGLPSDIGALIPCRSLWDSAGRRLAVVSIYETRLAN
ncbi:hypothetical protein F5Y15DRAFT_359832 [Xylariaceae sp. FL0016]|nr:hypothetical protein F5Y15DRAFT_359832 [Xylariaceae sp. FL0016]